MKCPDCHIEMNQNTCPQCKKTFNNSQIDTQQAKNDEVLEPEIVTDDNDTWNQQNLFNSRQQTGNTFKSYTFINNPNFNMNASCLPSFISVFLTLLVFFQLGFLAALGFIFFLLFGKAVSMVIILKNITQGKIIPPILLDAIVWIIAYGLVKWLAD